MTVFVLENVPPSLRGALSRWLIEVKAGVFVGKVSARVREELIKLCVYHAEDGTVLALWRTNTEQGFDIFSYQPRHYIPIKVEDIWLVRRPHPE